MAVSTDHAARWGRIVRMYERGTPMRVIAEREGVDPKTVYNVARRHHLPRRRELDSDRARRIADAFRAGTRVTDIAAEESVSRGYVSFVAKRAGLPPQPGARRKYPLDESAFDAPNDVGWWLIGLLAADGSVARRSNLVSLTQQEKDVDVLHAFLDHVGCPDRPLTELKLSPEAAARAWPRSRAFEARICSRRIKERLGAHGIGPRKTDGLMLSEAAAAQPAVWLGVLDGDGWVSETGQRGQPLIDFCGNRTVMEQCSAFWGRRLSFQRSDAPRVRSHHGGLGRVVLHGANARRAAEILLASSPISLQRKRRTLEAIAADPSHRPRE